MTVTALPGASTVSTPDQQVARVLGDIANGRMVLVVDDSGPQVRGSLVLAANTADAGQLAFLVRHGSGIVYVAVGEADARRLRLPPMNGLTENGRGSTHTVTVDATTGVSTGISAADRARTLRVLADPTSSAGDLSRPGHVMPVQTTAGGVLQRAGQAEAALDLVVAAGGTPAAGFVDLVSEWTATELPDAAELEEFALRYQLATVTVAELVAYLRPRRRLVERVASARMPLRQGEFRAVGYRGLADGREYLALAHGALSTGARAITYTHVECVSGDIFGSLRCDCAQRLQDALRAIVDHGAGVVLYLPAAPQVSHQRRTEAVPSLPEQRHARQLFEPSTFLSEQGQDEIAAQIFADLGVVAATDHQPIARAARS